MFKIKKFFFSKNLKTLLTLSKPQSPTWKSLNKTNTVVYKDNPREDIYSLLKFKPKNILDIGCYCGALGVGLKNFYGCETQVWGVEINPEAAAIAQTRVDKVTTISLDQWSAEELALLSQYDTVFLLDVLEHVYNPWLILTILRKHLPPHAQIIVSLPNIMHLGVITDLIDGYWHYTDAGLLDITHIRFFTPFEMQLLFKQTGYVIENQKFNTQTIKKKYFPFKLVHKNFTLNIQNEEQWNNLNSLQVYYQLAIKEDFNEHDPLLDHPPTLTNQGK